MKKVDFNMSNVSKNKHVEARASPVTVSAFCESDSSPSVIDTTSNTNVSKDSWTKSSSSSNASSSNVQPSVTSSSQRAQRRNSLNYVQPSVVQLPSDSSSPRPRRRASLDSLAQNAAPTTTATNYTTSNYQVPVWMQGSNINKAVFLRQLRHLILPTTVIQSHVRGMIQRQKYQKLLLDKEFVKRTRASTTIQALARGWFCQRKWLDVQMQFRLDIIEANHQEQLRQLELQKQREMERIYRELEAKDNAHLDQQAFVIQQQIEMALHLRDNSQRLSKQNKKLRKVCAKLAKKNGECLEVFKQTQENTQALENIIPHLQADKDIARSVLDMWSRRTEEFRVSLQKCQENIATEKAIGRIFENGIETLLDKVADDDCTGIDLMEFINEKLIAGLEY
jgi:hypothetical protein